MDKIKSMRVNDGSCFPSIALDSIGINEFVDINQKAYDEKYK